MRRYREPLNKLKSCVLYVILITLAISFLWPRREYREVFIDENAISNDIVVSLEISKNKKLVTLSVENISEWSIEIAGVMLCRQFDDGWKKRSWIMPAIPGYEDVKVIKPGETIEITLDVKQQVYRLGSGTYGVWVEYSTDGRNELYAFYKFCV